MATLSTFRERYLARLRNRLAFKELALRHCNHSKQSEKLTKEVKELRDKIGLWETAHDEFDGYDEKWFEEENE